MLIEKNLAFLTLCFLASTCISTGIGMYGDKIRVSHGFDGCQILEYIAVISNRGSPAISWRNCSYQDS